MGSSDVRQPGQIQAVDLISDDESTTDPSLDLPPAYEHPPQEIDIDQDGFHARATAACMSAD